MKRSEINRALARALEQLRVHRWALPAWADWSADDFAADPETTRYLDAHQMGWDVTDFGSGDFLKRGLTLFCVRNGLSADAADRPYAEKLLFIEEGQETPMHAHKVKMEDIINRGGGTLVIEFVWAEDGDETDRPIEVTVDAGIRSLAPREKLRLAPGESVTIPRGLHHRFYAAPGEGAVFAGEVSQTNDDKTDNYFLEPLGRFSAVEEDEQPLRLLWNEALRP
jgi:D-lyxose ketol-isomerase